MAEQQTLTEFRHKPLPQNVPCMRVFRVLPPQENEIIRIRMRVIEVPRTGQDPNDHQDQAALERVFADKRAGDTSADLQPRKSDLSSPSEPYQCLSYQWGNENDKKDVHLIDERHLYEGRIRVRPNLHAFLRICAQRALQSPSDDQPWWWVDALCINQDDVQERAKQVRWMGSIYQQASGVYVWLGNEPGGCSIISQLASLRTHFSLYMHRSHDDLEYSKGYFRTIRREEKEAFSAAKPMVEGLEPGVALSKHAFYANNPYWQRLWIIQEIALARSLFVVSSEMDFTLACFEHCLRTFNSLILAMNPSTMPSTPTHVVHPTLFHVRHLLIKHARTKRGSRIPVPDLLHILTNLRPACSDSRDQVYGILAIGKFAEAQIQIDYTIDEWELLMQVASTKDEESLYPLDFSHCFTLMKRLEIDILGNFDHYASNAQSRSRSLYFENRFHHSDLHFSHDDPRLKWSKARHVLSDVHDSPGSSAVAFWHFPGLHSSLVLEVGKETGFGTLDFCPVGFQYRYRDRVSRSYREYLVPVNADDIKVCQTKTDMSVTKSGIVRVQVVGLQMSELLFLKQKYWSANPENSKARKLLGLDQGSS